MSQTIISYIIRCSHRGAEGDPKGEEYGATGDGHERLESPQLRERVRDGSGDGFHASELLATIMGFIKLKRENVGKIYR